MVQFTIAYVALGVGLLLVIAGAFAVLHTSTARMLSPYQRRAMIGALGGMLVFIVASLIYLRSSLWLH